MSPRSILKNVRTRFPELQSLPKAKLRLVEEALVYASELSLQEERLTDEEHDSLIKKLGTGRSHSPGDALRSYRLRQDLTQGELAHASGIPQANISALENGRRALGLMTAKKLASVLGCDYRKLV